MNKICTILGGFISKSVDFAHRLGERRAEYIKGDPLVLTLKGNADLDISKKSKCLTKTNRDVDFSIYVCDLVAIISAALVIVPILKSLWAIADGIVRRIYR